jgi:hypothetical protein
VSFDYIRRTYKVPAKRGARVRFNGLPGRIVGSKSSHLRVRIDGSNRPITVHPTWEMEYLPAPTVGAPHS